MPHSIRKRVLFSFVVARTHKMFVFFLALCAIVLFCLYLFLLNRVALQGYILTKEAERKTDILRQIGTLDSSLARLDTREYLLKKSDAYAAISYRWFSFVREKFTALK